MRSITMGFTAPRLLATLVLAGGLAACSEADARPGLDEDLRRELEAAKMEMRPTSSGTDFIGPVEETRHASAAPAAPRTREVARKAPRRAVRPEPTPAPRVAEAPAPAPEPQAMTVEPIPAARRPMQAPTPQISAPPPGGYKSVNEVMRNAPFPINP